MQTVRLAGCSTVRKILGKKKPTLGRFFFKLRLTET